MAFPFYDRLDNAVLIPGNGCGKNLNGCMWYPWIANKLSSSAVVTKERWAKTENTCSEKSEGNIAITLKGFPHHLEAYEHVWKPFAIEKLGLNEHSILIGHSSGAACSLRLMEENRIGACLLVSAYNSDLGDELERESGYFSRPFDYDKMVANCPVIFQFHSKDDHLVPVSIAREVAKGLEEASERYNNNAALNKRQEEKGSIISNDGELPPPPHHRFVYVEVNDDGHFQDDEYEAVMWDAIKGPLGLQ